MYNTYISDSLLLIQKSLGYKREDRYIDYVSMRNEETEEEKTGEEIIGNIKQKVRGF